jgi:hypothetical protein
VGFPLRVAVILITEQTMKTLAQINELAANMANLHFYADPDTKLAWEPFENYSEDWVEEQTDNLAEMLIRVMLWAQKND